VVGAPERVKAVDQAKAPAGVRDKVEERDKAAAAEGKPFRVNDHPVHTTGWHELAAGYGVPPWRDLYGKNQ
jgi:hypothetical protein